MDHDTIHHDQGPQRRRHLYEDLSPHFHDDDDDDDNERLSSSTSMTPVRILLLLLQFLVIESWKMATCMCRSLLENETQAAAKAALRKQQKHASTESGVAWRHQAAAASLLGTRRHGSLRSSISISSSSDDEVTDLKPQEDHAIEDIVMNLNSEAAIRNVLHDMTLFGSVKTLHLSLESQASWQWQTLPMLARAIGSHMPCLQEIIFSNARGGAMFLPLPFLNELLQAASKNLHLQRLECEHCYFVSVPDNASTVNTTLSNQDPAWDSFIDLLTLQEHLQTLQLVKCWHYNRGSLQHCGYAPLLQRLTTHGPNLQHLIIDCWKSVQDPTTQDLQSMLVRQHHLQTLSLKGFNMNHSMFSDIAPLLQDHPSVQTLHLSHVTLEETACAALIRLLQNNTTLIELELHPEFLPTKKKGSNNNNNLEQQQPFLHDSGCHPWHYFLSHTLCQGLRHNAHLQRLTLVLPRLLLQQPLQARIIPRLVQLAWLQLVRDNSNSVLEQLHVDGTVYYQDPELQSSLEYFLQLNQQWGGRRRLGQRFEQMPPLEWMQLLLQQQETTALQDNVNSSSSSSTCTTTSTSPTKHYDTNRIILSKLFDIFQLNPSMLAPVGVVHLSGRTAH